MLPTVKVEASQMITVPVTVTTDTLITFAQFVVEYNANALRFDHAENGRDATGFTLLVQPNLPFPPAAPGTNKNVLAQISSAAQFLSGSGKVAVNLYFNVIGVAGDSSALIFDPATNHTVLSTRIGKDIFGSELRLVNGLVRITGTPTRVAEKNGLPSDFVLEQNYPNPFRDQTEIRYSVPSIYSQGVHVQLRIYNIQGQLVRTLVDELKMPGRYQVGWDGRGKDDIEATLSMCFIAITFQNFRMTKKIIILR